MKTKGKRRRKKSGQQVATAPTDTLDNAIKFVEQAGSVKQAKAALDKIERIKSL